MGTDETTASDSRTAEFLDVEATARNIAARLAKLDDESNRYTGAAKNLDEAAAATRELAASVREVGVHASKAIDVVASVGGPEIVARLGKLETQQVTQSEALMKKVGLAVYLSGAAAALALVATIVALAK
ncbi:MAG: hypothetical protein D9V44_05575 [Actinobacteria bacterium]|nr:MAG: hypothetical protein D9V44_05575 [Actinomycetota bacterium]